MNSNSRACSSLEDSKRTGFTKVMKLVSKQTINNKPDGERVQYPQYYKVAIYKTSIFKKNMRLVKKSDSYREPQ